ncbi:DUF2771 domain-containing protein [Comamonas thiooxydans]|uniref:DUF2771 domain-containing protein n=1 Tax=Comamonas thiooxydans TaxID=363952 RepID=UPI00211462C0|nr:DUF2771 domain-containing protein [Comamonas thiooxydans]UUE95062.1 DUF2771 domain-containing protein [Comamonas thiooxydans]
MTAAIRIEIPKEIHEDDWKDHLQRRINEFRSALDLSVGVDPDDHRLEIHGLEIDSLEIHEDEVFINYNVNWSVYYGCDNQDAAGDEQNFVSAERNGHVLTFQPHVYPERRSTLDEY